MAIFNDSSWYRSVEESWKDLISRHRPDLCKAIDIVEFVDHLESLKVFNNRTCQTFRSMNGKYSQVSAILTALLKRPFDDFVKFCQALESSGQRHIIDQFFMSNRETAAPPPPSIPPSHPAQPSPATHTDARPSIVNEDPLRSAWKDLIRNNYPSLVNDIDPDNGLMAHIISKKIVVEWMQDTFMSKEGRSRRAAAILDHLLLKRPYEDFVQFCTALRETNQEHIVNKYFTLDHTHRLNQSDSGSLSTRSHVVDLRRTVAEALSENDLLQLKNLNWKAVFVETRSILVDGVSASNEFINLLFALGVFNAMSYEACEEKQEFLRMEFILDFMRRRPDEDFIKFCSALAKTNQAHIIKILLEHKVEKQSLSNSVSPSSEQPSEVETRTPNHQVVAQPMDEAPSINAGVQAFGDSENKMDDGESRSLVCQPQDDSAEQHHTYFSLNSIPSMIRPHETQAPSLYENFDDMGPSDIEHVIVKNCSRQFYQQYRNDAYAVSKRIRGTCLIINNKFVHGLSNREGTEKDRELLAELFEKLHFEVDHCDNATAGEIKQKIERIAADDSLRSHQCFVMFVLSHGQTLTDQTGRRTDCIYGSDGNTITVNDILAPLTDANCPNLIGKPRLVFFQACRGDHYQTQTDAPTPPVFRDFLISYPTQRGYVSFRNTELGSWYINALVQVFMEKACITSLSEMLNMVSGKIGRWSIEGANDRNRMGQSSTYESHLTKSFYFFPGISE